MDDLCDRDLNYMASYVIYQLLWQLMTIAAITVMVAAAMGGDYCGNCCQGLS